MVMHRTASRIILVASALIFVGQTGATVADDSAPQLDQYRQFAIEHSGDATAGEQLYRKETKLACANCHNITGAEKNGPNLDGIADKYSRRDLIENILRPSLSIKPGYEQTTITTRDGRTIMGRVSRMQKSTVKIMTADGKTVDVQQPDIDEIHESKISMMPDNVALSISQEQFADLVAYLETLHFKVTTGFLAHDQPIEVKRIKEPVAFQPILPPDMKFSNPVWCSALSGVPAQLVVLEHQECKMWRLEPTEGGMTRHLFVDLTGQVKYGANWGLMCVAFHPQFKTNRRYFLKHQIEEDGVVKTAIVERLASEDLLRDSGEPSRRLLAVECPAYNHNGGCIGFGPDGMLYIGFGDGGFQHDPNGNGQNPHAALAKMLRIDVDHRDEGREYAIPKDNPFAKEHESDSAHLPEIWASGFREPWRFSFDSKTGDLWVGDVGQDKWEEVCLVHASENHGWNVIEGYEPHSEKYRREGEKLTPPLYAYPHSFGVSVTGGYVYRGSKSPSFDGVYIFGDYETRRVWGLKATDGKVESVRELGESPLHISSFGVGDNGEIYVVGYEGSIFHLDLSHSTFE
jgi:putative heme-binding domain-containing protein